MRNEVSRTATGMPVISIFNKGNENRITIALSDPANATVLSAGVVEEKGNLRFKIDFFPDISPLMSKYEVVIRIDRRKIPFYQSLKDTKSWWSELGFKNCHIPESTRLPTYSAWYSYHQEIDVEAIIEECKHAKELGMDTIIIDDGWQTDDSSRGYAYCGDWKISKKKIPDMKYFVDSIHKLGMKFVIWFSVPYMGFKSENFERFKGMYLKKREHMGASVLDPRYKEVRDFLVNIYCSYVKEYGWDGLKLDFIDSFSPDETSSTDYEKMDCVSVEEGVGRLLSEVATSLKKINPEFMIEFRQSYVGPIMTQHGNFFRVTDCPGDPMMNRIGCLSGLYDSAKYGKIYLREEMKSFRDDYAYWYDVVALEGRAYGNPEILAKYRVLSDSITSNKFKLIRKQFSFYRGYLKENPFTAAVNTLRWGIAGIRKFS
jgi:alpha-galactosidase